MSCLGKTLDGTNRVFGDFDVDGDLEVDDLDVKGQLILNYTGEPQILSENVGFCWGNSSSLANGTSDIVIGTNASSTTANPVGNNIVLGTNSTSSGITAVVLGSSAASSATQSSVSIGWSCNVTQSQGCAVGPNADVSGASGSAFGNNATVTASNGTAIGNATDATQADSTAVGYLAQATGVSATALGDTCTASGSNSLSAGQNSIASGDNSIALGNTASASVVDSTAIGRASSASASNAWAVGKNVSNAVADSFVLFDSTMTGVVAGSLYHGPTDQVWNNLGGPVCEAPWLYTNNAASYTMGKEVVNGKLRNTYTTGTATITWPSRTTIVTFLENYTSATPSAGTQTKHNMWKTTIINSTTQTITLTAGTAQTAIGTSLSAGIGANETVTFESYLTGTAFVTVRTSTQGI